MSDLPFSAEYAKSGRASCKGCKEKIDQGTLRIAAMVQSAFFDGKQANWYHEECFFKKQRPKATSDIGNFNALRNPDRKRIQEAIESYGSGIVEAPEKGKGKGKGKKRAATPANAAIKDFAVEYSKSSRATCRVCEVKIVKDEVRISKTVFDTEIGQKYGGQALWHHVKCFAEDRANLLYLAGGEQLPGFKSLSKEDQSMVKKEIPPLQGDDVPIKKLKDEPKDEVEVKKEGALKKKIETQNNKFFKFRDALRDLKKGELEEILEFNNQEIPQGPDAKMDRIADGMLFGAVEPCPKCKNGQLVLNTDAYYCTGDLTEWTKCQYKTQNPKRVAFKIPSGYGNPTLKKFKGKVGERVFDVAPKPTTLIVKHENGNGTTVKVEKKAPPLKNLQFFIYGKTATPKEELKKIILKLGGLVLSKLVDTCAAVVSTKRDVEKEGSKMQEIRDMGIEVIEEEYFKLIDADTGTPANSLQLIKDNNVSDWGSDPLKRVPRDVVDGKSVQKSGSMYAKSEKSAPKKLKLKHGTAVDPDSGLEDEAHVYKDQDGTKYSVVLGQTDITSGKNSYYKLQVLEADHNKRSYWLFRAWGRIGTTIGGNKTEKCKSVYDAQHKFEELYLDKTENPWEAREHFVKVPGKMYPIDVDYGEDDSKTVKIEEDTKCSLPAPIQKLIIRIFDINLMKRVMMEFELDTEKMPLGKLSKKQMKAGYKVLSELQEAIEQSKDKVVDQDKIVDATNRFYTLIPHSFGKDNPPLLNDEELIKTKSQMLDSLMEIEIAYSMLKSEDAAESDSPIEMHYRKLRTRIELMDQTSEEYKMLVTYTKNTHAETHTQYELEILQVYKVMREGEDKRYKPFRKLHNRRLLWHGSRTTNFAGILSQGIRIAPPEAPATGYMFGKGIYFADMVSKSANYCCTSRNDPVGILMLCEVALGNMKQCTKAEFVKKLPADKHSVWGMGRTMPNPEENKHLEDGTIVPLGKPTKHIDSSALLYNEFIVYDVAQVHVKYLFEMKFNYKF